MIQRHSPDSAIACQSKKRLFTVDCENCSLRSNMLFANLETEGFGQRTEFIKHSLSSPKETIYHQGHAPDNIFSLRYGFVKLIQLNEGGEQRIIRILGPGDSIGLEALQGQNYRQTAEAITAVDYCTIPTDIIFQIAQEQPSLHIALEAQLQKQLEETEYWLNLLVVGQVKQRLCRFLLLQHRIEKSKNNNITLISNQDIASILATSEETVSRCLSELRKHKDIEKIDKRIYHLNLEAVSLMADIHR
jgi:CRP-like cAMP-binding protein